MMGRNSGKIVGIMGTIILHLMAALIFMSVKLSSVYKEKAKEFLVEFQPEQKFIEDNIVEVPKTLEELFEDDDRFKDIIKNIANPPEVKIDAREYENMVKEELIASGLLGKDNFIDEKKNSIEEIEEGETLLDSSKENEKDKEVALNELTSQYEGPTRIFYDLAGRYHIRLPIPIYKCEGSGVLVINIVVNQQGVITESKIDELSSSTLDQCLTETALLAISKSRFNPDDKAPKNQSGTVTFHFVAQ
jgi:hypothetical protein